MNSADPEVELNRLTEDESSAPLHFAVSSGNYDVVVFLIHQGADVNQPNKAGNTPLHIAVSLNDDIIARTLLACRANPRACNKAGKKPSDVARACGHPAMEMLMAIHEAGHSVLPSLQEIEKEMALQDASRIRWKNLKFELQPGMVSTAKMEELLGRISELEQQMEQYKETIANLKAKAIPEETHVCAACFKSECSKCPTCDNYFCETCVMKGRVHKCAASGRR